MYARKHPKSKLRDVSKEIKIAQPPVEPRKRKNVAHKASRTSLAKKQKTGKQIVTTTTLIATNTSVQQKTKGKRLAKKGNNDSVAEKGEGPKKKYKKPTDNLVLRVPPISFMQVMKDMPDEHKKAIQAIGFGGFFHLDMPAHKSSFAESLVRSFDVDRHCLVMENNQVIHIKQEDAHIAYGLPMGGKNIVEPKDESDERWSNFLRSWRARYNLPKGSPTNQAVIRELARQKMEPVTDDFVRDFILCAVNCCIRSTCNPMLRFKFLYSCMDINLVNTYNWSAYVCKAAEKSVLQWVNKKSSYFTGPLPFLMV